MRTIFQTRLILLAFSTLLAACASDNSSQPGDAAAQRSFASADHALRLAGSLQASGAETDALNVLAAAHERYPNEPRLASAYGRQALLTGHEDLAGPLLRRAVERDPQDWRALSALAVLEGRAGYAADARATFLKAQSAGGSSAVILNNLGVTELIDGRTAEAAELFRRALTSPDLPGVYLSRIRRNLAFAVAVGGDFDMADRLAGGPVPRQLAGANGETIARLMGMTGRPAASEWVARIADASETPKVSRQQ